jgi:ATP-dependent DNA ligase
VRKATLVSVLAKAGPGLRLNEHMECDDGEIVFRHACKMDLEGIVSKRKDSPYRSGRSSDWLKMKNPAMCGDLARYSKAKRRMMLKPSAGALASVAERPLVLPLT